jgi:hypothetical protein
MIEQLYSVISVIDDWSHRGIRYDNVEVIWFVDERGYDPGFDYAALLSPGDETTGCDDMLVFDLFTREEADQLAEYLRVAHQEAVVIREVDMPIKRGYMPISGIAVGGDCNFYMLSEHKDYDLPFRVWGYYRIFYEDCANLRGRHVLAGVHYDHDHKHCHSFIADSCVAKDDPDSLVKLVRQLDGDPTLPGVAE